MKDLKITFRNYIDLLVIYPLEDLKKEVKRRVMEIHEQLQIKSTDDLSDEEVNKVFMELVNLGIIDMNLESIEKNGRPMDSVNFQRMLDLGLLEKGTRVIFSAGQIDWDNFYFYLTANHWYKEGYGIIDQVLINWRNKGITTEEFREVALRVMWGELNNYSGWKWGK